MSNIDLTNWKITLPIPREDKKVAMSIYNPELSNFRENKTLESFMYADDSDNSIVFNSTPGYTTPHSPFSRTELREQMIAGSDDHNWTFKQGGHFRGVYKIDDISVGKDNWPHGVIIMQIHGRLSDDQCELVNGPENNNFLPPLKVAWRKGFITVRGKELINKDASYEELLREESWKGTRQFWFPTPVGFNKFAIDVIVNDKSLEVILNDNDSIYFDGPDIEKWVAHNYFKAGSYLHSKDEGSFAKVKLYELKVSH